jgi:hypothetical protein
VRISLPEFDGRFVGHKSADAGMFEENFSERRFGTQAAKNFAATQMDVARNGTKDSSVRAFAGAGRAKQKYRPVFHALFGLS